MKFGWLELVVICGTLAMCVFCEGYDAVVRFTRWFRGNWPMRWARRAAMISGGYAFAIVTGLAPRPF